MHEIQVIKTTFQEILQPMQEGEAFYFQKFFEKTSYCIDVRQFGGLTIRNVINHNSVLNNKDWQARCCVFNKKLD